MAVRVRFAPSPTGYLHIGGARTALFNWLFAKKTGGQFILRIEDTDLDRSSGEMVQEILDSLQWLGLGWDEGPYFQSQRLQKYREAGEGLVKSGHAYYCFCSPEELAAKRERAAQQKQSWKYDGTCRRIPAAEAQARRAHGEPAAIRFRVPQEGMMQLVDVVFGEVATENSGIEDFVLLRSDGHPTYHLSVVIDDLEMSISHVIRGADHLSNTPKQLLLYEALGRRAPVFAHVPLILGQDRSRLSKRHGATSVTAYREMGFIPEAFRNFLALLGWSPGSDRREIYPTEELIAAFSLEGISRTNAIFNLEKALWMNSQYIASASAEQLSLELKPLLEPANLEVPSPGSAEAGQLQSVLDLVKSRARSLNDLVQMARPFLTDDFDFDPAAVDKNLGKHPELQRLLPELAARFAELEVFDLTTTESALRKLAEERGVKAGLLINAARTAITGSAATPGIFDVLVHVGKERVVRRLRAAVDLIPPAVPTIENHQPS